ncbi:sensor histidine kinase [Undibacterium sp. Jales W-56]|uniref:sensor histidine kinase n=1 Tax=Undibacterium sp. Jales W-56 TaxID=2897325 RepID=UPI0021D3C62E|nr:ATP-binding protein [Undibacterium sp. Jales W-56]MCU6432360.1 sensor histidine kinase [Undibacterium sp. Jales W-56]
MRPARFSFTRPATATIALVAALFALAAVLVCSAYWFAATFAREELQQSGDRQLKLISLDLESALEKYETLPYSVAYLPLAAQLLAQPDDAPLVTALNLVLRDLQRQAKVAAIYLMDAQGKTIAASNWDSPQTYMGQNFSFRPYFRQAMTGQAGRFYAIGNTTNIPGYFIAQAVYPAGVRPFSKEASTTGETPGSPIGVIAVKISLTEFEQAWRSSEEPIALSDQYGVVFLSNRPDWQYRSLRPLDPAVQQSLGTTLQYGGKPIVPVSALDKSERLDFGTYVARPVGRLSWQLMLFPLEAKIRLAGIKAALVALLLLVLSATAAAVVYQRRQRLREGLLARQALQSAADELELRIAQRTRELTLANQQLAAQYSKLKDAENLLRSTQDEMVQTGKLAMLGQMAAGMTHELNQPLTAIRAFADNAVTYLARGNLRQAGDNLSHIGAASARMGSIIAQLKGFARKSPEAVAVVDMAQSLRAAALLVQSEFDRHGVQLVLSDQAGMLVLGDAVRIEQVLINLMRNALDATVQMQASDSARQVSVELEADAQYVRIRIIDAGTGLPEHVIGHLFEPFFTTKPSDQGLGLGLAISSSIVQAMNGSLSASNRPGGGAEFVVSIPRSTDKPDTLVL